MKSLLRTTASGLALAACLGLSAPGIAAAGTAGVAADPAAVPAPITRTAPGVVHVKFETVEKIGRLADGTTYRYWTFNGQVPGPMVRARVGDTVEVTLTNAPDSWMNHSVDMHAVTGPGGGSVATQTEPGKTTGFSFKALKPGLYVYHCATPMVAQHIANGMYGMILIEPKEGLPKVDREFYVMQGELYTAEPFGKKGEASEDYDKLVNEQPTYMVFNGEVGALTKEHPLRAKVGETIRIFFGDGGPNKTSSFHVIGEQFDKVYEFGSVTSVNRNVQTVTVAPGGAAIADIKLQVPGTYKLVDHALSRMAKGLVGNLVVTGPENPEIFNVHMPTDKGAAM